MTYTGKDVMQQLKPPKSMEETNKIMLQRESKI